MTKTFDLDKYMAENELVITLHGKPFRISDISVNMQEDITNAGANDSDPATVVKKLLGCTDKDLEGYGLVALAKIISEVTDHFFSQEPSPQNPSTD